MNDEHAPGPDHVLLLIDWPAATSAPQERERMMEEFADRVGGAKIVLAQQLGSSYGDYNAVVIVERSDALSEQLRALKDEGWKYSRHDLLQEWWDGRDGKWRGGTNPFLVPGG